MSKCRERQIPLPFDDIEKFQDLVSLSEPQSSLENYLKPLIMTMGIVGYVTVVYYRTELKLFFLLEVHAKQ